MLRYGVLAGDKASLASEEDYVVGVSVLRDGNGWRKASEHSDGRHDTIDGRLYPVIKVGGVLYVSDPARALLLFVEALARRLALHQDQAVPAFSAYLDDHARELLLVGE